MKAAAILQYISFAVSWHYWLTCPNNLLLSLGLISQANPILFSLVCMHANKHTHTYIYLLNIYMMVNMYLLSGQKEKVRRRGKNRRKCKQGIFVVNIFTLKWKSYQEICHLGRKVSVKRRNQIFISTALLFWFNGISELDWKKVNFFLDLYHSNMRIEEFCA